MKMLRHNFIKQEISPNSIPDPKVDPSFRKISKKAVGFHVWKIEEDRLEAENKSQYGTFLDNCAYIIYACCPVGGFVTQDTITREAKTTTSLERFIHFWLGEKVSEQKRSNVAYKVQELDTYFGNVAVEYREVQDNESARFLSYFKRGITIRSSALASSTDPNRLFQLRGRKWLRCTEMATISWEHFGADYVMLLKTDPHIFIWMGRSSSHAERREAIELANRWQPKANEMTIVDDGYEQLMPEKLKRVWNALLPLKQRAVNQSSCLPMKQYNNKMDIYKCCYKGTRITLEQLDVVIPTKDDLTDSTKAYVLDCASQGVWVWIGSQASQQDNVNAMGNGRAFVRKKKYAFSTPVIRVVEGHEPIEFTRLFPNWHSDWNETAMSFRPVSTTLGKLDSLALCQRPKMAADTQLIDDGSGERTIFCFSKDPIREIMSAPLMIFSTHNSYVVRYTVVCASVNQSDIDNVGIQMVIYQWNGAEASAEVTAKAERFAKGSFEEIRDHAMYVQMCEFDETPHFLQIFNGKLVVLQDDKNLQQQISSSNNIKNSNGSNNTNSKSSATNLGEKYCILKTYGDASYNSKAVEIYPLSSMSTKECYVVKTNYIWVWCGLTTTGDAREVAKGFGALLGEYTLILEGKEPKEFWRSITNQLNCPVLTNGRAGSCNSSASNSTVTGSGSSQTSGSYLSTSVGTKSIAKTRPQAQLFLMWALHGKFFLQEIIAYEQNDLSPECVYVLDTGIISYIWLGANAPNYEQERYMKMVQYYLSTVPIARRPTTAVGVVGQQAEPNVFKGFFENWNHVFWKDYITYEQMKQRYISPNDIIQHNGTPSVNGGDNGNSPLPPNLLNRQKEFDRHHKYPISTLQMEADALPAEVDPLRREVHLTHDDFVSLFNMSFWEFDDLPGWRKQELKKKCKLF